jgi:hypothetical protein
MPILEPIKKQHLSQIQEIFSGLPKKFIKEFLVIATTGINTEICTAMTLLNSTHNLLTGNTRRSKDWRNGGSGVLFSILTKDKSRKLQTTNMKILHEAVIPWLATENMADYRKLLASHNMVAVFMHSCGDERFNTPDWNEDRKNAMLNEQFLRTEIDYKHGVDHCSDEKMLFHGEIQPQELSQINQIIEQSFLIAETLFV